MYPDQSVRVLVVEDQALLAMELDYVLRESGHEVVGCAMDAIEALAIAGEARPEVALVDVNLRDGLSGPEIAQRLIQDHGVVAVFLTANPEQIPEGFSGAIGVVVKPFDAQTLREVVDFAGRFGRERVIGDRPLRLRLAPWLLVPSTDLPKH